MVFEHVRHLNRKGIPAMVFSLTDYPKWIDYQVPFRQVDSWVELKEFDIVVSTYFLLTLEFWKTQELRDRLIHFCQGFEGDYKEWKPYEREIDEAYSLPLPIWTVSQSLTRKLRRKFPDATLHTIGQGFDPSVFFPPDAPPPGSPVRVVLMGPYNTSIKEIPFGLKVLKEIKNRFGPEVETIRISPLDTRGLEKEIYLADSYLVNLTPPQVAEVLRNSHILFSPSNNGEGFGLPVLEAMACGCATCVSSIDSYLSWGDTRDYALFFPVGDFSKAVEELFSLIEDAGLRKSIRSRGFQVCRGFSFERVVERIEQFVHGFVG